MRVNSDRHHAVLVAVPLHLGDHPYVVSHIPLYYVAFIFPAFLWVEFNPCLSAMLCCLLSGDEPR